MGYLPENYNTLTPLISILLPVFNAQPYLKVCLESILNQYYTNWELLAVNDFSTDNSLEILQAYAADDTRIKVFSNTQKGIIPALRKALSSSTGAYVTRMDADDLMPTDKLESLYQMLQGSNEGSIATGLVEYFSDKELGEGYRKYETWLNRVLLSPQPYRAIYKECVLPSAAWLMKKTDLIKIGGFDKARYPEDYDLCFRAYAHHYTLKVVPKVVHLWRDHPTRTSRNDPHYSNPTFFKLKLFWFLQCDHQKEVPLVLWGAGKKGKQMAKYLIQWDMPFHWITDNEKKLKVNIYGIILQNSAYLQELNKGQVLISVSGPSDQKAIASFLKNSLSEAQRRNIAVFWFQ